MSTKNKKIIQDTLCINTEKIYDWIVGDSTGSTTIDVDDLPIALPADATNVEASCTLTDEDGDPIPINTQIDIVEVTPREERQIDVDGELVTLERVRFRKTIYATLEVSGVDPATGTQFLITSDPVSFNFVETAFLCAPEGTAVVVSIADFSCLGVINRDVDDVITDFDLEIFVCQSIQAIAPVAVEVAADLCMPREELIDRCAGPVRPPQCDMIFPGHDARKVK